MEGEKEGTKNTRFILFSIILGMVLGSVLGLVAFVLDFSVIGLGLLAGGTIAGIVALIFEYKERFNIILISIMSILLIILVSSAMYVGQELPKTTFAGLMVIGTLTGILITILLSVFFTNE